MPLDRDIKTGYTKSWERQRPRFKVNDSGDVTNALHRRFNEKQRQRESENIARAIGQKDGNYFFRDRRGDNRTGIVGQFLNAITGRGKGDEARKKMLSLAKSGAYYPPRSVNTLGLYAGNNYNYPEAKEVVPKYTYGGRNPWANIDPTWINEDIIEDEITKYGGSPSRAAFYEDIAKHYEPGGYYGDRVGGYSGGSDPKYGPLAFEQQMTDVPAVDPVTGERIKDKEGHTVRTTGSGIQYFPEIGDYYKGSQAGAGYDISYPDPNMIYSTGDYGQIPYHEMFGHKMPRMGMPYYNPERPIEALDLFSRGGIASLKR